MQKTRLLYLCLFVLLIILIYQNCSITSGYKQINPDGSIVQDGSPTLTPTGSNTSTSPTPTGTNDNPIRNTNSAASWFSSDMFFNQSIKNAPVDSQSATIISNLDVRGGWGNSNRFQIDFSIDVYYTDSNTITLSNVYDADCSPDCDNPNSIPVPQVGSTAGFESSQGRICDGGDCHYSVVDRTRLELLEAYQGEIVSNGFHSMGVSIWPFSKNYLPNLRGEVCTSADAGGFPIAPMLFSPGEVASGTIKHAIRFILPNPRIQCRTYVLPATHGTGPSSCSGWATSNGVPYGARFRLKSDFNLNSLPNESARVVARALQEYGMILADGGQIALTAQSDKYSSIKWSTLLSAQDLVNLKVTDFEMIEAGARHNFSSYDCVRNP